MKKSMPYRCESCIAEDSYYGRLVWIEEALPVFCPHHRKVALVPA